MRIAILGAGAIGSTLGALLHQAGQDVTLVGRSEHVRVIQEKGLQIIGALEAIVQLPATDKLTFRPDLVLLTVKTQDVWSILTNYAALLEGVPIVTFQNGVRSDDLVASVVPQQQIISTVVNIHATYLHPGIAALLYPGSLTVGNPFNAPEALLTQVADLLRLTVPTSISRNIQGAHWLKLLLNLNNAFPALTDIPLGQLYDYPEVRRLALEVMREGFQAVTQANITLDSLPDVSLPLMRAILQLPAFVSSRIFAMKISQMEHAEALLGSTLQSLRRHRSTEIDYLNGEIVDLGRKVGMPTPLNTNLVALVHQVEQTGHFLDIPEMCALLSRSPRSIMAS